jgi:hypothetical protein
LCHATVAQAGLGAYLAQRLLDIRDQVAGILDSN